MRRFYASAENFRDGRIVLSEEETRHLRDVLRLREGDRAQVFDGAGREFLSEIETIEKRAALLRVIGEIAPPAARSKLDLTLAVALLKGDKFEFVVQKAVELGVARFVPLTTQRCDVKIKAAADFAKKLERLNKIALEACKQSGRADLMKIENLIGFEKFVQTAGGAKILFAERGGARFSEIESQEEITALVGSEGGWEDAEIELARRHDFRIVTFGGRILRAETAAVSIAAVLQHRFGDLN